MKGLSLLPLPLGYGGGVRICDSLDKNTTRYRIYNVVGTRRVRYEDRQSRGSYESRRVKMARKFLSFGPLLAHTDVGKVLDPIWEQPHWIVYRTGFRSPGDLPQKGQCSVALRL